jgi:hypothetical protein
MSLVSAATETIKSFGGFLESGSAKLVDHITWLEVQLNLSATATYSGLKVSITDASKRVSDQDVVKEIAFTKGSLSFTGPQTFYINKPAFEPNYNFEFISTVAAWNIQVTVTETSTTTPTTQNVIFNNTRPVLPTLSDYLITESASLQSGDIINFTGLTVNDKPASDPSINIMFNQEGTQTIDIYEGFQPLMDYNSFGNYTTAINTLPNDRVYRVEAIAKWTDVETKPPQLFRNLIVIKRPEIDSVTPLDIQNDGGNDGVGLTEGSSQTVLTVFLKGSDEYNNYVPHDVVFKLYLDGGHVATTSAYAFQNLALGQNASYDIKLSEITRGDGVHPLTNGTAYTVKAELQISVPTLLTLESGETPTFVAVTRVSEPVDVSFSQNVAPVSAVTIGNSWLAVCGSNPSSNVVGFNASPVLGISGSFDKTAQFGTTYSKNLDADAADTKFLLEYTVDDGANWSLVPSCSLIQTGAESEQEAFARAAALIPTDSLDGLYANVAGPNSMVFFIPSSSTTIVEQASVKVRVSVLVAPDFWKVDGDANPERSSASESASIIMVNKVGDYSFVDDAASEPFNSIISSDSLNILKTEGSVQSSVLKSSVVVDLTKITTQNDSGWLINKANTKVEVRVYDVPATGSPPRFKTNQLSGLGVYALIKQAAGAVRYPYFNVYTIPKTGRWYTSRLHYELYNPLAQQPPVTPGLPLAADELVLLYTGVDVPSLFPGVKRVYLPLDVVAPSGNSVIDLNVITSQNENINSIVFSNSAAVASNFDYTVMESGVQVGAIDTAAAYGINMKFSKLLLNIPVDTQPHYFNSSKVDDVEFLEAVSAIVPVTPIATKDVTYSVKYSIKDPNTDTVVWGLPTSKTVPNKYFPVKADFAVTNFVTTTTNGTSISFDLALLNPTGVDRIDGVNAYITYKDADDISQTDIIGSYITGASDVSLDIDNWPVFTSAEISFIAFRDERVNSIGRQVETALSATDPFTVRKVPVITPVSGILLVGGIVEGTTTLSWDAPEFGGVVVIDDIDHSGLSKVLDIADAGVENIINVKVMVVVGGFNYYSVIQTIKFVSGSVDTTSMTITPVIDNSTGSNLQITYTPETSSGVNNVSRRLINNSVVLSSVPLLDAASYDFSISEILNTLSILVKARVEYFVDLSSYNTAESDFSSASEYYVARPSAAGVGIKFAGGFTNADTVITLSNMDSDADVSYKLGSELFANGEARLLVTAGISHVLEITRVYGGHASKPDKITFTPGTVDSFPATITVDGDKSTATELYATIVDNISDTPDGAQHEIFGLYSNGVKLVLVDGYYPISGIGETIELSLKIRSRLQYKLNEEGDLTLGEYSPDFVGDALTYYYVSAKPSLTDISGSSNREIRMLTQLNAATPISVVFLVTQEVGNAKEYLLKFNVEDGVIQSDPDATLSGVVGSAATGWKFVYADGGSVLTAPLGALSTGKVNVLAILSTLRGTDIQISEIDFS